MAFRIKTNGKTVLRSIQNIDGDVQKKMKKSLRQMSTVLLKRSITEAPISKGSGSGGLRQSINADFSKLSRLKTFIYSAGKKYAEYIHRGTGIYGKYKTPIRPVRAKLLKFKINGKWIAKREVKGIRPNPFLQRALGKSIPSFKSILRKNFKK